MAIAKVVFNGEVKIDVTQKTVSPENLLSGETALAANGLDIEGNIASKTSEDLILENSTVYVPAGFYATDASKYVPGGGGGGGTSIEPLTITPTTNRQVFYASTQGYEGYSPVTVTAMPAGQAGIPIAEKGTVSNNTITITPSVTNIAGYIASETKTGNSISVSAAELVSGTLDITTNGDGIDVTNYAAVNVSVPSDNPNVERLNIQSLSENQQIFNASDFQVDGFDPVVVPAIPNDYVGTGVPHWGSSGVGVTGPTVTIPAGYFADDVTKTVAIGTLGIPFFNRIEGSHSITLTPTIINPTIGYIETVSRDGNPVTISAADLVSGEYSITANGDYNITNYATVEVNVASNFQEKTNINPTTSSQTITPDSGYSALSSVQINAMPLGTAGTPIAGKGAVSNHSVTVTPSVTNTTGYITGSTITGTGITVTAAELVSDTKTITINSTGVDVRNYAFVDVNVAGGSGGFVDDVSILPSGGEYHEITGVEILGSTTITENGTYDILQYDTAIVNVASSGGIIEPLMITPSTTQQVIQASSYNVDGFDPITVAAMPEGTAGIPTATKGVVSDHSISVTPSVTNTTGYITGDTKTGTAVTVTAAELVSGTRRITANAENIDVTNLATITVDVNNAPSITPLIVTPNETEQIFDAVSGGDDGYNTVTVEAIPSNYVGTGISHNTSADLTINGATITAPSGYYESDASATITNGAVVVPDTTISVEPTINIDNTGLITSSVSVSRTIAPTVTAGYVSSGTSGTITAQGDNNYQLSAQAATTYYPSTINQTITAGKYLTGAQTISKVITSGISAGNIKFGTTIKVGDEDDDDRITGTTGTFTSASTVSTGQTAASNSHILSGYSAWVNGNEVQGTISTISLPTSAASTPTADYTNKATIDSSLNDQYINIPAGYNAVDAYYKINKMPVGSVSTLTISQSEVINNSITLTPVVNHNSGYISSGASSGTSISISASQLTSGTRSITSNGTFDITNYKNIEVNVPTGGSGESGMVDTVTILPSGGEYHEITAIVIDGTKTITANGTGIDVRQYAMVDVNVSNTPNIISLNVTPTTAIQTFDATLENADGYNTVTVAAMPSGSAATPATTITANPTVSISDSGLITASYSGSRSITPTITAGYIASGTAGVVSTSGSATQQLTTKAAATYNVSSSDQTIAAGQYLTGIQTIRGVTTSGISAANIKTGTIIKVGDANDDDRITSVTGTFTASNTVSTGQTAANASKIISGYSAWVDGNEIKGSLTTTNFANEPTTGVTYTDISDTAPVLVSGSKLYISEGYTGNWSISLAKLVPDGASAQLAGTHILSGYSAYNNDGVLIAGTIPTKTATNVTVSGASVTIPVGYYSTEITKTVASGAVNDPTATKGTVTNHSITVTPSVSSTAGYISGGTKSGTGVVVTAAELVSDNKTITANGNYIDVTNFATVTVNVQDAPTLLPLSVTPAVTEQTFIASEDDADGYSSVTVAAMPAMTLPTATQIAPTTGYSQKAIISRSTDDQYINIGTGYNSTGGYYKISATPNGSVTAPASISGTAATVSASSGTITLTKTVAVTPNVTSAGYISSGTSGNSEVTLSASANVKGADVYLPSDADQSIIAANTYVSGIQTLKKVTTSGIIAANIKAGTVAKVGCEADDDKILSVSGTFTAASTVSTGQTAATANQLLSGYSAWVDGTEIKGSILSKNAATYYPSTTNQTIAANQYLSGTQTIKALTITNLTAENIAEGVTIKIGDEDDDDRIISITGTHKSGEGFVDEVTTLPGGGDYHAISGQQISGTLTITSNGTYDVSGYANVVVQI